MSGIKEFVFMQNKYNDEDLSGAGVDDDILYQSDHFVNPILRQQPNYTYVNSVRDISSLPLKQVHQNAHPFRDSPDEDVSLRKHIGNSISLVSLITENLLCHPFVVLRRQCQVHHNSARFHLVPVTLFPVIYHIHRRQGVTTLWKGIGSSFLVRGMSLGVEDLLSKVTPWPKELTAHTTTKQFVQHICLKCISFALVMPFYCASLVETVQSDIASEKPGFLDVFREGGLRLLNWSAPKKGRMVPVWILIGPSIGLHLGKYIFGLILKGLSHKLLTYRRRRLEQKGGTKPKAWASVKVDNIDIYSTLVSVFTTEVLFYPLETILHRLQLQGTRTIIDNLDSGYSVIPIMTNYDGFVDCYRTTVKTEGFLGLYKGFGAVLLQFAAHVLVLKAAQYIIQQVVDMYSSKPSPRITEAYNLKVADPAMQSQTPGGSTLSHSLSSLTGQDESYL